MLLAPEPAKPQDDWFIDECLLMNIGNQRPKYIFQTKEGDDIIWEHCSLISLMSKRLNIKLFQ